MEPLGTFLGLPAIRDLFSIPSPGLLPNPKLADPLAPTWLTCLGTKRKKKVIHFKKYPTQSKFSINANFEWFFFIIIIITNYKTNTSGLLAN